MKTFILIAVVLLLVGCGGGDNGTNNDVPEPSANSTSNYFGTYNLASATNCADFPQTFEIYLTDSYYDDSGYLNTTETTQIKGMLLSGEEWFTASDFTMDKNYYYIHFTPKDTNYFCYAKKSTAFTNIDGSCEIDGEYCSFSYK